MNVKFPKFDIHTNIIILTYSLSGDLAYFDGLSEVILTAGLVLPKPGIFQDHIKFLLVLTTPVDIVILGVSFAGEVLCISEVCIYIGSEGGGAQGACPPLECLAPWFLPPLCTYVLTSGM